MKNQISIYHYCYLPLSQTFIHGQLLGLEQYFTLKIFSRVIENQDEFPGFDPVLIPPRNLLNRLIGKYNRIVENQLRGSSLFHVNFGNFAVEMQHHARRAGIPMTAYFLGEDASSYVRDPIFKLKLRKATFEVVFVNSLNMKSRLTPFLPPNMKCYVVYCGIPLARFPFKQRRKVSDGATFLQVSRLDPKKGVDITLKAFSRYLCEIDPHARLILAGDGPLRTALLKLTTTLGLDGNVIFAGPVGYRQYIELLQSADVFVHPSVTTENGEMEGLPTAICEAMACGLPILSTHHSGIPEVVDDGINGYLVAEKDDAALFAKMVQLRQSDIAAMSRSARYKIETKFDHNDNLSILAGYMNRIITGGVLGA